MWHGICTHRGQHPTRTLHTLFARRSTDAADVRAVPSVRADASADDDRSERRVARAKFRSASTYEPMFMLERIGPLRFVCKTCHRDVRLSQEAAGRVVD